MADRTRTAPELETEARAINAEPWDPPPGMIKRQCPRCGYFFASSVTAADAVVPCPDCVILGAKRTAAAA